jgi:DNA recombination protein RmuC
LPEDKHRRPDEWTSFGHLFNRLALMDPSSASFLVALLASALVVAGAFVLGRRLGQAAERAAAGLEISRLGAERARFEAISQRVPPLERELTATRVLLDECEARLGEAQVRIAEARTRLSESEKAAVEKLEILSRAEVSMKNAFQALSTDALDKSRAAFLDQAHATFGAFRESALKDFAAKETTFAQLVEIRGPRSRHRAEAHRGLLGPLRAVRFLQGESDPLAG